MSEKIKILDVEFDNVKKIEALKRIKTFLRKDRAHQIVTPNPEFLLEAKNNEIFMDTLNIADLSIPDGIGILWAAKLQHQIREKKLKFKFWIVFWGIIGLFAIIFYPKYNKTPLKERVTGADLMLSICEQFKDLKVFLLGAKEGVAKKVAKKLEKKYEALKVVGYYSGSPDIEDRETIIELINSAKPDVLFVAFSFPNQDIWISENLERFETVKAAIGIGGTFDYIAGEKKRAPLFFRKIGLEWVFRLFLEPKKRFRRIYNAVVKFPIVFMKAKMK